MGKSGQQGSNIPLLQFGRHDIAISHTLVPWHVAAPKISSPELLFGEAIACPLWTGQGSGAVLGKGLASWFVGLAMRGWRSPGAGSS